MVPAYLEAIDAAINAAIERLLKKHPGEATRVRAGVHSVARFWREVDGDADAFEAFCCKHFIAEAHELERLVARLETALCHVDGHLSEIRRNLRRWSDLRGDDFEGVDDLLALFNPAPDLSEQFYRQKIAFLALLNGPVPTLREMLEQGAEWDDTDWAWARIRRSFGDRVPEAPLVHAREVRHAASTWVDRFQVPVGHMVDENGRRWFEPSRKLIAHWHLRDRIKAQYGNEAGLPCQRALAHAMRRHIDGSLPRRLMDGASGEAIWDPVANTLDGEPVEEVGLVRYDHWLAQFHAARRIDEHSPSCPTAMARRFDRLREMPEEVVEGLLVDLLSSPVRKQAYALVREQLGRELEAHDIYYQNLAPEASAEELDRRVRETFGTIDDFAAALPDMLGSFGFAEEDAAFLARNIRVEVCKGAGHAVRPGQPEYGSWMRTSSLEQELGWDGYETAMHELGHNIEQVVSTHFVPRPMLRGVPNTACTEAFAFLYESQARRLIGLPEADDPGLAVVQRLIEACEIAGPGLLELRVWRWLYAHPDADAAALRDEVVRTAGEVWDAFYAPFFGPDRYLLMAAYQHMISHPLYLPDYALGYLINHQIASHVAGKNLAEETKRICSIGDVTPDLWMRRAVGQGISAEALTTAVGAVLGG